MIPRMTTVGTLKNYRYNLNRSNNTMTKGMQTVLTRRNFNTYAEDPALAVRCFQIRRSQHRTESQLTVNDSLRHKYDVAWEALGSVSTDLYALADDTSFTSVIKSLSDPTGPGRVALGQSLCAKAKDLAQIMNARYGENYVFAGADTLNAPFTWDVKDGKEVLCYRGVEVDSMSAEDQEKLEYFLNGEKKYMDVGLGHLEDEKGEAYSATVFDSALQGIHYLGGYGTKTVTLDGANDIENIPTNVVSVINEMGQILQRCGKEDGRWASDEDKQRFEALTKQFEESTSLFRERWTEMDTQCGFLRDNSELLENTSDSLTQQYLELEEADPAAAISEYMFARYCYDAALKVGNSVLSQSLMDYMNF